VSTSDTERKGGGDDLPHIDFATFVVSLSHSGFVHLGDMADPGGAQLAPNLPLARQTIDLLALLEEKTRGNLTGEEERLLSASLHDLRIRFVEVSQKK
jgi:hypothetical protein